jgi:hypothetical protein
MLNLGDFGHYLQVAEKLLFILGTVIYSIFALVVVKQTTTMSKNVNDKFNPILIAFAYLHFAFSLFLIFLTLVIL